MSGVANLNKVVDSSPLDNSEQGPVTRKNSLKNELRKQSSGNQYGRNDLEDRNWANLNEVAAPSPVQNPNEGHLYHYQSLEDERREEGDYEGDLRQQRRHDADSGDTEKTAGRGNADQQKEKLSKSDVDALKNSRLTQLYTISYLVLFAIFGTLARLGLQAITFYPGAPVIFSELWANFGGSLIMGFLSEDRQLFQEEWGSKDPKREVGNSEKEPLEEDFKAAKKAHLGTKKTIPLYIGLATGFCGSFTSFSSFIRDVYLALSNDLSSPLNHPTDYQISTSITSTVSRNGGYSFMALLAVIIITVSLSLSALFIGAHIAIALDRFTPSIPFRFARRILDPFIVILAFGCWLGAIFLAIFPPDRNSSGPEIWRGRAVFALVFAPIGCLLRYYASMKFNGRIVSFPLGTFAVNVFGTAILGMSYVLQHVPLGGVVGCQVLQGIEDGFCGCLSTVSTWVSELSSLRRRNAYRYGAASVLVSLAFMVVIMGSMQWTKGFASLVCVK